MTANLGEGAYLKFIFSHFILVNVSVCLIFSFIFAGVFRGVARIFPRGGGWFHTV